MNRIDAAKRAAQRTIGVRGQVRGRLAGIAGRAASAGFRRKGIAGRAADSGQVFVLTAMSLAVLLGCASLAVDVGYLWNLRRQLQSAADAAAIGGTTALAQGSMVSSALNDARQNGFQNGVNGVTVTVNNPPASGAYAGDPNAVEAIITQTVPSFFLAAFGYKSVPVTARAVARAGDSPGCVYALDPSVPSAFSIGGTSGSLQAQCGIQVNSSDPSAMAAVGGACITAASIGVVGGYSASSCPASPTPVTGVVPAQDPLAYLAPPTFGSCDQTKFKVSGGKTATLDPGVYCDGITLSGGSTAVLNPGTYILNGGGLSVGAGSNIQGSGVTFYNTGTSKSYSSISLTGGSTTTLSAPTSGPFKGILFFQDRNIPTPSSWGKNVISGGSTTKFEGDCIFPRPTSSSREGLPPLPTPLSLPGSWKSPATAPLSSTPIIQG